MNDSNIKDGDSQRIGPAPDLRKWRTEIPNIYDDADLEPLEFRLLVHYTRVGKCNESARTTARRCHMSHPTVLAGRASLAEKGWITLTPNQFGGMDIQVVDVWEQNFAHFTAIVEAKTRIASGSHVTTPAVATLPLEATLPQSGSHVSERIKNSTSAESAPMYAGVTKGVPPGGLKTKHKPEPKPKKSPSKKKRVPHPSTIPPAVKVFFDIRGAYPRRETWIVIDAAVGSDPDKLKLWADVLKGWVLVGWNPINIAGQIECFKEGRIPQAKKQFPVRRPSQAPESEDLNVMLARREKNRQTVEATDVLP